jgi:hypothetical protein
VSLAWPQGSDYMLIGMKSGLMFMLQLHDGISRVFPAHNRGVYSLAVNPNIGLSSSSPYALVASCSADGSVSIHACERSVNYMQTTKSKQRKRSKKQAISSNKRSRCSQRGRRSSSSQNSAGEPGSDDNDDDSDDDDIDDGEETKSAEESEIEIANDVRCKLLSKLLDDDSAASLAQTLELDTMAALKVPVRGTTEHNNGDDEVMAVVDNTDDDGGGGGDDDEMAVVYLRAPHPTGRCKLHMLDIVSSLCCMALLLFFHDRLVVPKKNCVEYTMGFCEACDWWCYIRNRQAVDIHEIN